MFQSAVTLLVALKGLDGLVLASDSRGTFGDPRGVTAQNDTMIKSKILAKDTAVLIAGSSELGALLVKDFPDPLPDAKSGTTAVMEHLRNHAKTRYQEWFSSLPAVSNGQPPNRPDVVFMIAGYDTNEAVIYQLTSALDFAPQFFNYGFAVAGVPQYALYLLNRMYEPGRSIEELAALAAYVITETASQDGKVGGNVHLVDITADQGCRMWTKEKVEELLSSNLKRSETLKKSFYSEGVE